MDILSNYLSRKRTAEEHLDLDRLAEIGDLLFKCWRADRTLFIIGNGGSASTASHLVADLTKGLFVDTGRSMRVQCLTDNTAALTAWSNDYDYLTMLANHIESQARDGDYLIAISGSGRSPNILHAVQRAKDVGVTTVGLCGFDGGYLNSLADISLRVQSDNMQIVEDLHLMIGHMWYTYLVELAREQGLVEPCPIPSPDRSQLYGLGSNLADIDTLTQYPPGSRVHISRSNGRSMGSYLVSPLPPVWRPGL